jgi:hypothetical protein
VKPKARMLPAISATCASLCVRALRGEGTSLSSGQNSRRSRSPVTLGVREGFTSVAIDHLPAHPPTLNFATFSFI